MESFDFKKLKPTNFPDGAYLVILAGAAPVDGVVLSQMKVVVGWPNPILTTLQGLQDRPRGLLATVHQFLILSEKLGTIFCPLTNSFVPFVGIHCNWEIDTSAPN